LVHKETIQRINREKSLDNKRLGDLLSFDEWKDHSQRTFNEMRKRGYIVIHIIMEDKKVLDWLNKKNLINTNNNRKKYVLYRLKSFLKNSKI
jgi:hypothetical protein